MRGQEQASSHSIVADLLDHRLVKHCRSDVFTNVRRLISEIIHCGYRHREAE